MREQTIAMYCFLDDLLTHTRPAWARPADPRRRLSDAEVLTTALVLGCTEIPLLLSQADFAVPVFDTVKIHTDAIVNYMVS